MKYPKEAFLGFIKEQAPPLSDNQMERAAHFAEILHQENELQNLTRIIGVEEFYFGHLLDVMELFKLDDLGETVLDIGSGCGVPGLLAAAIDEDPERAWHLVDSEASKAQFLERASQQMGLINVSTYAARVESIINNVKPDTIMARAVGTVDKIAAWIWDCSTWNNLILFKSIGWDKEWEDAAMSRFGKKLTVTHTHEYAAREKHRKLITLKRK